MKRIICVYNPKSRGGSFAQLWQEFTNLLDDAEDIDCDLLEVADGNLGDRLTGRLLEDSGDYSTVTGGDGTHCALINALLRFQKSHPERRPISYLPIPFGTGNDIAKSVGFKPGRGCVPSAVQAIPGGGEHRRDLGRWRSLYFADAFSIGLDVAILATHNAMEAALGQRAADCSVYRAATWSMRQAP